MGDTRGWILLTTSALVLAAGVTWVDVETQGPQPQRRSVELRQEAQLMRTAVPDAATHPTRADTPARAVPGPADRVEARSPRPPALRIAAPVLARELVDSRILARWARLDLDRVEWREREDDAALRQLVHGQCQLAIVTGKPGQRPEIPGLEFAPLGDYVLAFLRDPRLSVRELRASQVHRILTGNHESWRKVGGKDVPIAKPDRFFALTSDSRVLVPSSKPPIACYLGDVRFVQKTEGAFAALDLTMLSRARREMFVEPMLVPIDGVAPTLDAFRQGRYGPGRRLWIAWRKDSLAKVRTLVQQLTAPATLRKFAPRLMPVGPVSFR